VEPDKNIEQELADLLADPRKVTVGHTAMLNELLQEYPYYQPLHLLLAKANQQAGENNHLTKAALYTNGQALHQFLFSNREAVELSPKVEDEVTVEIAKDNPTEEIMEIYDEISEVFPVEEGKIQEPVDDAVFEEIAEVDYVSYRPFKNGAEVTTSATGEPEAEEKKPALEDNFVFESIASTDFFAFQDNFDTEAVKEEEVQQPAPAPVIENYDQAAEAASEMQHSQVSNYHDEKLPYTFLWWLAKTRKEHQTIFQPYATPKKGGSNELQQQYVEHIFHVQSHLTGNEQLLESEEPAKPMSRDFEIIDSFIRNDPQILPPNAEQIDNENKAKKSAEDQNDLVSETLAGIYIEQMLYDKAIDTYEKLSLKFPEKSRYFADLIQSIEKKI